MRLIRKVHHFINVSLPSLGVTDYSPAITAVTFSFVTGVVLCGTFALSEDTILEDAETFTVTIFVIDEFPTSTTVTISDNDGQYIVVADPSWSQVKFLEDRIVYNFVIVLLHSV